MSSSAARSTSSARCADTVASALLPRSHSAFARVHRTVPSARGSPSISSSDNAAVGLGDHLLRRQRLGGVVRNRTDADDPGAQLERTQPALGGEVGPGIQEAPHLVAGEQIPAGGGELDHRRRPSRAVLGQQFERSLEQEPRSPRIAHRVGPAAGGGESRPGFLAQLRGGVVRIGRARSAACRRAPDDRPRRRRSPPVRRATWQGACAGRRGVPWESAHRRPPAAARARTATCRGRSARSARAARAGRAPRRSVLPRGPRRHPPGSYAPPPPRRSRPRARVR